MPHHRPDGATACLRHVALIAAIFLAAPKVTAQGSESLPTACTIPAQADTILRAPYADTHARAHWIARSRILWPKMPRDGRYALYHSATAALRVERGSRVTGSDGRIALRADTTPLPPSLAERIKYVGDGARLTFTRGAGDIARLLGEQTLVVREDDDGRVLEATALQLPLALDDRFGAAARAKDLGAIVTSSAVHLALWAPTARAVAVCVYPEARGDAAHLVRLSHDATTGIWRARLAGDLRGAGYLYLVEVFVPGAGIVRNRVTDPYSVALTADSRRSVLLSLDDRSTMPDEWRTSRRPPALAASTDLTIYELHVRDFSASDTTVRPAWRGKYLAFAEPQGAGMSHLRALRQAGITDVHLLPVYDLSTIPEQGCIAPVVPRGAAASEEQQAVVSATRDRDCFNWGYDPFHYTVPEGSYATDGDDPAGRIREFRAMVQALHGAGLRVGMDVVYNHTFAAGQQQKSVLDRIVPGYYHRLSADGAIEHSTCCENTATEHAMMGKLMVESVVTWARHYRIDSFRFDLMGHQPRLVMARLQRAVDAAVGRHVPLIGEGWNFGEVANGARFVQASQLSLGGSWIGTFSDRARDALRGGGCCDGGEGLVANQGLLNGLADAPNAANVGRDRRADLLRSADLARVGLAGTLRDVEMVGSDGVARALSRFDYAGQPAGYAAEPGEVVNYVENHDNLTLFDLNALRLPRGTSREQRARAQLLGVAFVALSQGIAYLHAGIEILRSKSLDRDSFDSGDWFNRIDWSLTSNGFGAGLPPAHRNRDDWSVMRPILADTTIAPTPALIRWTRDATLDLLRIRTSSTLFRLRTAADVKRRLHFRNVGALQDPSVMAAHLDGRGYPGATFREVLYLINVASAERSIIIPEDAGKPWALHPVHRSANAADRVAAAARFDAASGRFTIPARTAVVFVVEGF